MTARFAGIGILLLSLSAISCAGPAPRSARPPEPVAAPSGAAAQRVVLPRTSLTPEQQALHVLNRLGYGPRPGDVERVIRSGPAAYIEAQLQPGKDTALDDALRGYPTLGLSSAELARQYPRPPADLRQKVESGEMTRAEVASAYPPERRPARVVVELQAAKLTRALASERQLDEVMVDFWFNHFNVYAFKGAAVWMLPDYEREAIRPHALGRYRDLLVATARHPAMLFYLDNWLSVRDGLVPVSGPNKGRRLGLNENY